MLYKISLIFKTIEDDVTGATANINILGRSITEVFRSFKKDGFKNGLKEMFFNSNGDIDVTAIDRYNKAIADGSISQAKLESITKSTNTATKNLITSANGVTISESAKATAINQTTFAAKAGGLALKALSVAGNLGVLLVFTKAIEFTSKKLDNYINKNEIAIEKANNLKSNLGESVSSINDKFSSFNNLIDPFNELSQGVDTYGKNVSLTSDEMEKYNGLINEIVKINPMLVKGYDAEGNAIINKNNVLAETIALLEREKQLELEKATSTPNLKTIGEGAIAEREALRGSDHIGQINDFDLKTMSGQAARFGKEAAKLFDDKTIEAFYNYTNTKAWEKMYGSGLDLENYLTLQIETFSNNMDDILEKANIDPTSDQARNLKTYVSEWQTLNKELESIDSSYIDEYVQKIPQLVNEYSHLSDSQKDFISEYIRNGFSAYDLINDSTGVKSRIIGMVENISSDNQLQSTIEKLFSLDKLDIDPTEYSIKYKEIIDEIISQLDISDNEKYRLKVNLSLDVDNLSNEYEKILIDSKQKFNLVMDDNSLEKFFAENNINTVKELDIWRECVKVTRTATEAKKRYLELSNPKESFEEKSLSGMLQTVSDMENSWKAVNAVYQEFIDKDKKIDAVSIQKVVKELKDLEGVNIDSFIETLTNTSSTTKDIQNAFNNLAHEYIYASGCLEGLTDATKDLVIADLEAQGIINANVVVTRYLALAKEYAAEAGKDLVDASMAEIAQFVAESAASEQTKLSLARLELAKIAINKVSIDTSSDIDQVIALANAAGASVSQLEALNKARASIAKLESKGLQNYDDIYIDNNWSSQLVQDYQDYNEALEVIKKIENGTYFEDFKGINPELFKKAVYTPESKSKSKKDKKEKKEKDTSFDWIEVKIERLQDKIDQLKEQLNDVDAYQVKNKLTDTVFDQLTNKIDIYNSAYDKYINQASAVGLSESYKSKVQNGEIDIETVSDSSVSDKIKEYQDLYKKAVSVQKSIRDTKKELSDLAKTKLDNIVNDFSRINSLLKANMSFQESLISLKESLSQDVAEADYHYLIKQQNDIREQLSQEYDSLNNELNTLISNGTIEKYSEEWYQFKEKLVEIKTEINECSVSIKGFKTSIEGVRIKAFDDAVKKLNDFKNEINDVLNVLGNEGLMDRGMLTEKGLAKLGLYAQQLQQNKQAIADYTKAMKLYSQMLKDGVISQSEYNDKLAELQQGQRDAALSAKQAMDAMIDLRKQGIQAQIDDMKELTQSKKDALDAEKNLHDYQKSVAEKVKKISLLQRKINILSQSEHRDDIAEKIKLEKELSDLKGALEEEQYQHFVDEQKKALDKELSDYEKIKNEEIKELESNLDKQLELVEEYLSTVTEDHETVYDILSKYSEHYGIDLTDNLVNPWISAREAAELYRQTVEGMDADFTSTGGGKVDSEGLGSTDGQWKQDQTGWWYENSDGSYTSNDWQKINGKWYRFDGSGYMQTGWYQDDNGDWYYLNEESGSKQGQMLSNTTTPDGNYVNSNGVWVKDGTNNNSSNGTQSGNSNNNSSNEDLISSVAATLKSGTKGDDVKKLQKALKELGYDLSVDGIFGAKTEKAVKAFQTQQGINPDGVVGSDTKEKFKLTGFKTGGTIKDVIKANGDDCLITAKKEETIIQEKPTKNLLETLKLVEGMVDFTKFNDVDWTKVSNYKPLQFDFERFKFDAPSINNNTPVNVNATFNIEADVNNETRNMMEKMVYEELPSLIADQIYQRGGRR